MRIEYEIKLGFKDVMFRPKRSTLKSRSQVDLEREFTFLHTEKRWNGVPIIAANMDTVGTFEMAVALSKHKVMTAIHKHYSVEEWAEFLSNQDEKIYQFIALSTGTGKADEQKTKEILENHPKIEFICIDVANGYSEHFVGFVQKMRKNHPDKIIIAGNVVTGEMVEELLLAGADIIKVGIGPGSVCTTRVKTGVGYPQLSAIIECADAAHGLGGQIIADGGCKIPGDVAKAFGGGADFVMLGGMFAGHDEGGGKIIKKNGSKVIEFYGSSSETALNKHYGGHADYRSSEGKKVQLQYRGKIKDTVLNIPNTIKDISVNGTDLKPLQLQEF